MRQFTSLHTQLHTRQSQSSSPLRWKSKPKQCPYKNDENHNPNNNSRKRRVHSNFNYSGRSRNVYSSSLFRESKSFPYNHYNQNTNRKLAKNQDTIIMESCNGMVQKLSKSKYHLRSKHSIYEKSVLTKISTIAATSDSNSLPSTQSKNTTHPHPTGNRGRRKKRTKFKEDVQYVMQKLVPSPIRRIMKKRLHLSKSSGSLA